MDAGLILMGLVILFLVWLVWWVGKQEVRERCRRIELEHEVRRLKYNSHDYKGDWSYPELHEDEDTYECVEAETGNEHDDDRDPEYKL